MKNLSRKLIVNNNSNDAISTKAYEIEFSYPEKVLQFGTGALLRGFADYFIDKANKKNVFKGRIVAVSSTGSGRDEALKEQDGLFTLKKEGIKNGEISKEYIQVASISRTLSAVSEWEAVLKCAENPDMDIILSNTTEVGIQYVEESIVGNPPSSFPAKLLAFLFARYNFWKGNPDKGMMIIPCELIVDNADKLKEILLKVSEYNKLEHAFTEWLLSSNTFCNTLVDRIVTGYPEESTAKETFEEIGYTDKMLTVCEVYSLWAIQGNEIVRKRLGFADANEEIIITEDITPYRERKLRILNGGHSISIALGYLCGKNNVIDCMNNHEISSFFEKVILTEIVPTLPVDQEYAKLFANEVLDRFRNPFLQHALLSISLQFTSKMQARNVLTIERFIEKFKKTPDFISLGFAAYLWFMRSSIQDGKYVGEHNGTSYIINDNSASVLSQYWDNVDTSNDNSISEFVSIVLADQALWKIDLSVHTNFVNVVSGFLKSIIKNGAYSTLVELNKGN